MTLKSIIPLGTSGWIPTERRQTTCIALIYDERLVLLDAGGGLARCLQPDIRRLIAKLPDIDIVLSHFHLDHIVGLTFAPLVFEGKRVAIYGPGPLCSGQRTEEALQRAFARPFFSLPLDKFPMHLTISDLAPGDNDVRGLKLTTRIQEHSDPSIGIRISNAIAFVTDTGCVDATVDFVRGSKILFHDAYYDRADYEKLAASPRGAADLRDHGHGPGVAKIAQQASVERAYLIHLNPEYDERRLRAMEKDARRVFRKTIVASDMARVEP